jgi:hypothetical protein
MGKLKQNLTSGNQESCGNKRLQWVGLLENKAEVGCRTPNTGWK